MEIASTRLRNQLLTLPRLKSPAEVVSWFGAVQAQDFAAAKWALGLRTPKATDASIEEAFNNGEILRTHIMRPTWHFVTPNDIRWILQLTSPRVHRFNGFYYRKSGLDKDIFLKSNAVIKNTLQKHSQLTRKELNIYLKEAHIPTENLGLSYTLMQAELDGIICSGPRKGKQFTYMLLDERVPYEKELSHDTALSELTKRYFQSHGPAQIQDFAWWSGLTIADVKKGISMLGSQIQNETVGAETYWHYPPTIKSPSPTVFLIPPFDEYFIAYKDRRDILASQYNKQLNQGGGMINGAIIVEGKMIGGWRRVITKRHITIKILLFESITQAYEQALQREIKRYGDFLAMPIQRE